MKINEWKVVRKRTKDTFDYLDDHCNLEDMPEEEAKKIKDDPSFLGEPFFIQKEIEDKIIAQIDISFVVDRGRGYQKITGRRYCLIHSDGLGFENPQEYFFKPEEEPYMKEDFKEENIRYTVKIFKEGEFTLRLEKHFKDLPLVKHTAEKIAKDISSIRDVSWKF